MASVSSSPRDQQAAASAAVPAYRALQRWLFAICIVAAPVVLLVYGILNPMSMHVTSGSVALAVNAADNPTANRIHLVLGILLTFLLPLAFLGMAWLALRRAPWLATIAGLLSVVGWVPWAALIGQEGLSYTMALLGGGAAFADLWNRYNGDFVITAYLLIYIIGHLLATILLGIALGRTQAIPIWAAWALALSSPLQIVAFPVHQFAVLIIAVLLWIAASIPSASALLRGFADQPESAAHSAAHSAARPATGQSH